MANTYWPLFELVIRTPRLELRLPTDDELALLVSLIGEGIHPPEVMPFVTPWTRLPSPERERSAMQFHWAQRAGWRPDRWSMPLGVFYEGRIIGTQEVSADDFAVRREVDTGSWLAMQFQGHGFGKEMRAAVLHLAFDGLGAQSAHSDVFEWNEPSIGVSRSLGYQPNGVRVKAVEGKPVRQLRFALTRDRWAQHGRKLYDISFEGMDGCFTMFGLDELP